MKILIILVSMVSFVFFSSFSFADEIDDLIPCIIEVESGGDPHAVSPAGAIGLMQITPIVLKEINQQIRFLRPDGISVDKKGENVCIVFNYFDEIAETATHLQFTEDNLYNPRTNRAIGTWYLRRLKDHYLKEHYTIERLLASYNGGITRLRKNNYDISKMPRETRNYVKKVMRLYNGN